MQININSDAVVKHTNTLERISKKALPNAIRETLSKTALDVKKNTLDKSAKRNFVQRSPNFFKAFSKVEFAKGTNILSMKATVGMVEEGLQGGHNFAVKDLEQQETGGRIKGKSFIPLDTARRGGGRTPVRPGNRISKIKKPLDSFAKPKGKNRMERFVKSSIAAGVGGYVLGNFNPGILWRITSIKRKKTKLKGRGSNTIIGKKAIYSFKKKRSVSVKGTNFAKEAAIKSAQSIENTFILEAEKQIKFYENR
jgi:hypothetical protein